MGARQLLSSWLCGLVGVVGYPFSTPVPLEWCPEALASRGAGSAATLSHPVHRSCVRSRLHRLAGSPAAGTRSFYVSRHLPGRPPHQGSTLQDATWDTEAKPLDFLLAQPGPRLAPPEHKMWAPWQESPALSLPRGRQSPGQRLPASPPGVTLAPSSASLLIPAFLGPPERPEEVLIKDPEVGRKTEGFQGGMAISCHLIATSLSPT